MPSRTKQQNSNQSQKLLAIKTSMMQTKQTSLFKPPRYRKIRYTHPIFIKGHLKIKKLSKHRSKFRPSKKFK